MSSKNADQDNLPRDAPESDLEAEEADPQRPARKKKGLQRGLRRSPEELEEKQRARGFRSNGQKNGNQKTILPYLEDTPIQKNSAILPCLEDTVEPTSSAILPYLEDTPSGGDPVAEEPEPMEPQTHPQQQNRVHPAAPGAFAAAPGSNLQQRQAANYSAAADGEDAPLATGILVGDNGLAVAQPVQDTLLEADEIDPAELERKAREAKKKRCLFVGFSLLAIALGAVLGTVFGLSARNSTQELLPTSVPSVYPTTSPSAAPSAALDTLQSTLPKSTLEKLQDPASPQSRAMDWLSGHKNIYNLAEWRKTQLFALATFYYAMDGENWSSEFKRSWLNYDQQDECIWHSNEFGTMDLDGTYDQVEDMEELEKPRGILPCNEEGRIQNLFLLRLLQFPEVSVFVPPEIALLTSLSVLALPQDGIINSSLADFLPTELYQMQNLTIIDLTQNSLTGWLPEELLRMTNLTELSLPSNTLTGALPPKLGLLTQTTKLDLGGNYFTGSIPSQLGTMASMAYLDLAKNSEVTGTLPTQLGKMTNMKDFRLDASSRLWGTLPTEWGAMTNMNTLSF